MQITLDSTK